METVRVLGQSVLTCDADRRGAQEQFVRLGYYQGLVFLPVMPIGVEHDKAAEAPTKAAGVLTCDADRR